MRPCPTRSIWWTTSSPMGWATRPMTTRWPPMRKPAVEGDQQMTLNKMMIIGNLGADPELRYTPGGKAVAELRVAVNDRSKGADGEWQEETQWFRVELWEQAARRAAERLRKGHKVFA